MFDYWEDKKKKRAEYEKGKEALAKFIANASPAQVSRLLEYGESQDIAN